MKTKTWLHIDLKLVNDAVYIPCGLAFTNVKLSSESTDYGACSFELDGRKVQYRTSKITPTKTGQFVTVWKRDKDGLTVPFHSSDDIDFIVITARCGEYLGQFVFPKVVMVDKGIISTDSKEGKRGIRVYPPWDTATSKQAEKTQSWQTKYFFLIKEGTLPDFDLIRKLYSQ